MCVWVCVCKLKPLKFALIDEILKWMVNSILWCPISVVSFSALATSMSKCRLSAPNVELFRPYLPFHPIILKASASITFQDQSTFYITLFHHPFQFALCLVAFNSSILHTREFYERSQGKIFFFENKKKKKEK